MPDTITVKSIHTIQRRVGPDKTLQITPPNQEFDIFKHELEALLRLGAVQVLGRYVPPPLAQAIVGVASAGLEAFVPGQNENADSEGAQSGATEDADETTPPPPSDAQTDPADESEGSGAKEADSQTSAEATEDSDSTTGDAGASADSASAKKAVGRKNDTGLV